MTTEPDPTLQNETPKKRKDLKRFFKDPIDFVHDASGITLRSYQVEVMRAVIESVIRHQGLTFVVMFPRQSGKNELQAQIEAYLLAVLDKEEAEIVKVSPTWKPQSLNAMRRLERTLKKNSTKKNRWRKESGYIYRLGEARVFFLSGSPETNIVGATASTLLEVDEAQDVEMAKYDKDIAPMAVSTNATRVFWGTAWTSRTLLARELRAAKLAQRKDKITRVFVRKGNEIAKEVPAYARSLEEQVNRLGRNHPMIKSQYFSEEIDAEGGMFPERRVKMMMPTFSTPPNVAHLGEVPKAEGVKTYALLIDVAGEDEQSSERGRWYDEELKNPGRDSTALTVVEVDTGTVAD